MKTLEEIDNFGANAAEADALLYRCFQSHSIFRKVLENDHFLVLGRKGSGKTAISKYIAVLPQTRNDVFSSEYDFTQYPWEYHKLMVVPQVAEQERYLHSWRYFILLAVAKILLNSDQSQSYSNSYKKIEQFVIDTYGSTDPDITNIFQPGRRLRGLKKLGIQVGPFRVEGEVDGVDLNNLPRMFQEVNNSLQRLVLECLNPDNRYFVCFDGLDIGFQPDLIEYQQRLKGLILAAHSINVAAAASGCSLKVLIFLRTDIYRNHLFFDDKNKITRTFGLEIEWDKPYQDVTLKSMMERRFSEVLEIGADGAWEQVFDESGGMGIHSTKYDYILDHTFRRTRDMIEFCNCILNVYKHRRRNKDQMASQQLKFISTDIYEARLEYSQYFRDEIQDEIYKQLPDYEIYLQMLRDIGYQLFSRAAFFEIYERWKERLKSPKQPDEILEHLFDFSIIGFARDLRKGPSKATYTFKYLDNSAQFNRLYENYSVHSGLVKFLELSRDQPLIGFETKDPNLSGTIAVIILDSSGQFPISILSTRERGILRTTWTVSGPAVPALKGDWVVSGYLESIGPGAAPAIDPVNIAVQSGSPISVPYPGFSYQLDIPLPDSIPPGVYKSVISVELDLPDGSPTPIMGFYEAPIIQVYEG